MACGRIAKGNVVVRARLPRWRCSADRAGLLQNSLLTGNLTGNFAKSRPQDRSLCKKRLRRSHFSHNSLHKITGKKFVRTGNRFRTTGNYRGTLAPSKLRLSLFDKGHAADGPSWIDLAAIRVNKTESRFESSLNRLLQQNRARSGHCKRGIKCRLQPFRPPSTAARAQPSMPETAP
jgi:hypothetical protein